MDKQVGEDAMEGKRGVVVVEAVLKKVAAGLGGEGREEMDFEGALGCVENYSAVGRREEKGIAH